MTGCSFNVAIMHVVFYLDCRSLVFTGPRNLTNLTARPPLLYELEANETHPATINCHVDCFDNKTYNPILLLINAKNADPLEIPARRYINKTDYRAELREFNNCSASNYSEYEYDIYLHGDRLDDVVIVCGLIYAYNQACWGQTHAIVNYNTDNPTPPCPVATGNQSTTVTATDIQSTTSPTTTDEQSSANSTATDEQSTNSTATDEQSTNSTATDEQSSTSPSTKSTITAESCANLQVQTLVPIVVITVVFFILLIIAAVIILIQSIRLKVLKKKLIAPASNGTMMMNVARENV